MTFLNKNREIILDTETTGLSHEKGDRIVDIACVELIDHVPTGREYQVYLNPETQKMNIHAVAISGITDDFLKDKVFFRDIVDEFLEFIAGGVLVIHNAKFDIGFINAELKRAGRNLLKLDDAIDTLDLAYRKFPGAKANLNALCTRFGIDISHRETHGALIDCYLLVDVYLNLIDQYRKNLFSFSEKIEQNMIRNSDKKHHEKRNFPPTPLELSAHEKFLEHIAKLKNK